MSSVQVAPWGSATQGEAWSFEPKAEGGLVNISVWDGDVVDAISFVAQTPDGRRESSPKFGGDGGGGGGETKIELDWPREYTTAISGIINKYNNVEDVITSLEFTTNLGKKIGPFGRGGGPYSPGPGTTFALTISRGAIVGFHGRNTQYLNAIGLFVRP